MGKTIYLIDRSGADLDDKCGMAYWWNRLEGDIGIVSNEENEALEVGKEIHDDLSVIAEAEDPDAAGSGLADKIVGGVQEGLGRERAYRRAGWAVAFAKYIEPTIRKSWENVQTEAELILDRSPLWVPVTPDRVLRNRTFKDCIVYKEYKSTISASKKWLDSWKYSIQLHLGMKALEEETGTKPAYAQIMGLMKGDQRDGRLHHPYVWGYYNSHTGEWTHDYTKARGANWGPAPVWEYPEGIVEWVTKVGEEVAISQFPHSPPVMLNERMLNLWVGRKQARMQQVAQVKDMCKDDLGMRNVFFEMRTGHCNPAFGFSCPYQLACWNASVNKNPLGSGEYITRTPHHEVEIMLRKEGKVG